MEGTARRREMQQQYNTEHGIVPRGVQKSIDQVKFITRVADARTEKEAPAARVSEEAAGYDAADLPALIAQLESEMKDAAKALDFETAARLRDQLFELRAKADGAPAGGGRRRGTVAELRAQR